MKKWVGIILSLVGLLIVAVTSFPGLESYIPKLPAFIQMKYIMIAGLMLVILGVIFSLDKKGGKSGKIKQASEEVPIYEGEGKNRKIVGYKKE